MGFWQEFFFVFSCKPIEKSYIKYVSGKSLENSIYYLSKYIFSEIFFITHDYWIMYTSFTKY